MGIEAVYLLNDVEAMASAVPHLLPNQLYVLSPGEPLAGGAIAVVAPSTGLGRLSSPGMELIIVFTCRKAAMSTLPRPVQRRSSY